MSIAAMVETVARALGVWHAGDGSEIVRIDGFLWWVMPCRTATPVDPLTAAIILLGHARGLLVDLGECTDCRARGGRWIWENWTFSVERGRRDQRARYHRAMEMRRRAGWLVGTSLSVDMPRDSVSTIYTFATARPCQSCSAGVEHTDIWQPTFRDTNMSGPGRHTLMWEAAIISAMQRDRSGLTPAVRSCCSARYLASFDGNAPTRESLTAMGDDLQARGDVLGELVTAWLCGDCPRCDGDGHTSLTLGLFGDRTPNPCPACNGHGSVLGIFEHQVHEQLATIADRSEGKT